MAVQPHQLDRHNRVIDHRIITMVRVLIIIIPKIASPVETMVGMLIILLVHLLMMVGMIIMIQRVVSLVREDLGLGGTMANRVRVVVTNLARVVAASGGRRVVVPVVAVANLARVAAMVGGVVVSRAKHRLL